MTDEEFDALVAVYVEAGMGMAQALEWASAEAGGTDQAHESEVPA